MRIFDIAIPMVASAIAIWIIATYDLDEDKANTVRQALEARRNAV
jgi:GPH family glycoside/pentoside/hexuronide:cation symporter